MSSIKNGNIVVNGVEIQVYDDIGIQTSLSGKAPISHTHTLSNITDVDATNKTNGNTLIYDAAAGKFISKPFSTAAGSGANLGSYTLELSRWGVSNSITNYSDSTLANHNVTGINNALVWASQQGYPEVVFPKGTYLIDENNPIVPQSYMTLNLNGATLRVRDNGLVGYSIIYIANNQQFVRVTNGIIKGDRYTHDYTIPATHEFGMGIIVKSNARFISIDNLEILDCTGDGVFGQIYLGWIATYFDTYIYWEQGGLDTSNGSLVTDTTKIRSTTKIMMNSTPDIATWGYLGLYGGSFGGLGSGITADTFDFVFYNSNNTFNKAYKNVRFFDEVEVPTGASYVSVCIHQSTVPAYGNATVVPGVPSFPKHVVVENCKIHHCRRCAIAPEGKWWYIRDCEMYDISGAAPECAIDIEDGYRFNQHYFIENNYMHDIGIGINLVGTRHVTFKGNMFENLGPNTVWNECDQILFEGNRFSSAGARLSGETIFTNNYIHMGNITVDNDGGLDRNCTISNCTFHNSSVSIGKSTPYIVTLTDCRFYVDKDGVYISGLNALLYCGSEPQTIANCQFTGCGNDRLVLIDKTAHDWIFNNVSFVNTAHALGYDWGLPSGRFIGCTFDNVGRMGVSGRQEYDGCIFKNWDNSPTGTAIQVEQDVQSTSIKFNNCIFYGNNKPAMFFWDIKGRLEFMNNIFTYPSSTTTNAILQFWTPTFTCQSLVIDGNKFITNSAMPIADLSDSNSSIEMIIRNNYLKTAVFKFVGTKITKYNNMIEGVLDPYNYGTTSPTATGVYKLGQLFFNSTPTAGGSIGWVCTQVGEMNPTWVAKHYYYNGDKISTGGYTYQVSVGFGLSSGTTPKFPTTLNATVVDNAITWKNIGLSAVFRPYGAIS